jgi:hypothetical protein
MAGSLAVKLVRLDVSGLLSLHCMAQGFNFWHGRE